MKRAWTFLLLGLALCPFASHAQADTYTVLVKSNPNEFTPADITILVNDRIVWAFLSGAHTVTSDFYPDPYPNGTPAFDSGIQTNPSRFRRPFSILGDHYYYCILHGSPGGFGHAGVIRVASRDWYDEDEEEPRPAKVEPKRP